MSGIFDFFGLEGAHADDERLIMQAVRQFTDREVRPIVAECYEKGEFPRELIKKLVALGVLGGNLPTDYGCAGMNNVAYGLVMQELVAGDSGVRSFASVQGALCMYPIYAFGSEAQKSRYLPKMAEGELVGCFGLTEPNFGSNPNGMVTKAERVAEGWCLNGSKAWITNGSIADLAVVWAKDEQGMVRGFVVEKGTKGFRATETKHKMSLRASVTAELFFEDCVIPEENILPESSGLKSP